MYTNTHPSAALPIYSAGSETIWPIQQMPTPCTGRSSANDSHAQKSCALYAPPPIQLELQHVLGILFQIPERLLSRAQLYTQPYFDHSHALDASLLLVHRGKQFTGAIQQTWQPDRYLRAQVMPSSAGTLSSYSGVGMPGAGRPPLSSPLSGRCGVAILRADHSHL